MKNIVLVGHPNCGKTSLLNALTQSRQPTGNWPGVTVERKTGRYTEGLQTIEVVDLPGIYSLVSHSDTEAVDVRIACDFILENHVDVIVNVIDASQLERSLYLTSQLLELKIPMVIVLTMMDIVHKKRWEIDIPALSDVLGYPVVIVNPYKKQGIDTLKAVLSEKIEISLQKINYPNKIEEAVQSLQSHIMQTTSRALALQLLEDSYFAKLHTHFKLGTEVAAWQQKISTVGEEVDILISDARFGFSHAIAARVVKKILTKTRHFTEKIDRLVLNRWLGIPFFLGVMYFMFVFAMNVGGAFQPFFDMSSDAFFVKGVTYFLMQHHFPAWTIAFFASGIGRGLHTTVTFIPVIFSMFLFLSCLEASGYMTRAAFVMDRFMRAMGLPGKSFVPMIIGFGCNVPAVMAARTLSNKQDRILTIIMTPFMSCGARLAIYAVFVAAFFPVGGQNIVFALYLTGILVAVLTGFIVRHTLLEGEATSLMMELPSYHLPSLRLVIRQAGFRLKIFLVRAGKVIIPVCAFIGALNALDVSGAWVGEGGDEHSLLSMLGAVMTPIFSPMGIHADNWPATVGLLTGVLAKEVVIATLNTLYTQVGHLTASVSDLYFIDTLKAAFISIPDHLKALPHALRHPLLASAPSVTVDQGVYGVMVNRFDGRVGAFSYLLFILLYVPCVSTVAAMARELNKAWAFFSVAWSVGLAYGLSVIFYQAATWSAHPLFSFFWILGVSSVFLSVVWSMRQYTRSRV